MNSLTLRKISILAVMITALNPCDKNIVYAMEELDTEKQRNLNQSLLTAVIKSQFSMFQFDNIEKIKELVSEGADPNFIQSQLTGWSLMHYAAQYGNVKAIQVLASLGADIDIKDSDEQTPLHVAASSIKSIETGNVQAIKTLIELGADINAKDNHNHTPLDVAEEAAPKYGPVNSNYLKNMVSLKQRTLEHIRERIKNRTMTRAELDRLPEELKQHLDIPNDLP